MSERLNVCTSVAVTPVIVLNRTLRWANIMYMSNALNATAIITCIEKLKTELTKAIDVISHCTS